MNEEQKQKLLNMVEELGTIQTINVYNVELFVEENGLDEQEVYDFIENNNIVFTD
jgi:hypothetical protein